MQFDQPSLLAAIGISSMALAMTLVGMWLAARGDRFLLSWAAGLAVIVVGIALYGVIGGTYDPRIQFASWSTLLTGFALVYAGAMQFRLGRAVWRKVVLAALAGIVPTGLFYALGLSGVATAFANFGVTVILLLTALQYFEGRWEAPAAMSLAAGLYVMVALSFMACGIVLLNERQFVLTERPDNWAEALNAIAVIVGLSGVGALSLTLNQSRLAHTHLRDAMTDPLTGHLNRRGLAARYRAMGCPPAAAILFDLDHFKAVNDRHGHGCGDEVLAAFAAVLRDHTRDADLVARLGGEEFCVVLTGLRDRKAVVIAERVRAALGAFSLPTSAGHVAVTVSAGVAATDPEDPSLERLLVEADAALYVAKAAGRNRVHGSAVRLVA
jgi:diguanylate cyclase (GGDEF)-like protein